MSLRHLYLALGAPSVQRCELSLIPAGLWSPKGCIAQVPLATLRGMNVGGSGTGTGRMDSLCHQTLQPCTTACRLLALQKCSILFP